MAIVLVSILYACAQSPKVSSDAAEVNGDNAMNFVKAQVAFGPRPPGSKALQKCRLYIEQQLVEFGYYVDHDSFVADTPYGPIEMDNLIARKGTGAKGIIALATHYDSKLMEGIEFIGANDPGSSVALVLELARVLAVRDDPLEYWFVFLDAEEAFVEWSAFDSTYGSRHLAQEWKKNGVAPKVKALILLDMIGDKNLDIFYETNSTSRLMDLVWETARRVGLQDILSHIRGPVEDDHLPFIDAGIPSVDIIDLNYGPGNSYHHTSQDTLDKVSPDSMGKVGRLVLAMLPELQR